MNPQDQRTIERLLEEIGAEIPGDSIHRYALRRSLMNSRYFEVHRARVVWERLIAVSGPAFAGGFVVFMVVLAVHVVPSSPEDTGTLSHVAQQTGVELELVEEELVVLEDDITNASVLPEVRMRDIRQEEPVAQFVNFMSRNFETAAAR